MAGTQYKDVMDNLGKQSSKKNPTKKKNLTPGKPLGESIFKGIDNPKVKQHVYQMIVKDLRSTDINALRLTSLYDVVDELANDEVLFLQLCERNGIVPVTDFQVQWRENRIGSNVAEWINLNVDAFASEAVMNRPVRTNTLGFMGNALKERLITQALAQQSPVDVVNTMAEEMKMEAIRIRVFQEQKLLSNEEVTHEGTVVAPRFGGMINRSSLYNTSTTGDYTNAKIQAKVDAIANPTSTEGFGYGIPLLAFTDQSGQIPKVRDLMLTRFGNESSFQNHLPYQDKLVAEFAEAGIAPNQIKAYQPDPGSPVLFMYNRHMPANTTLYFDPRAPKLGRFKINGQYGIWAIDRPATPLYDLKYVFDGITLVDGMVELRAVETGTGS